MKDIQSLQGCLLPNVLVFKNVEETPFKQKLYENHDLKNIFKNLSVKDTL